MYEGRSWNTTSSATQFDFIPCGCGIYIYLRESYQGGRARRVPSETLYHRDDALLYIAYVMLIWAAPIPADRWHCSL